jgi:hypothetical protein
MKASTGHRSPHYPDTTSEEWERGYAAGSRAETSLLIAGLCFSGIALVVVVAWALHSLGVI